jgi:hypothetical protein
MARTSELGPNARRTEDLQAARAAGVMVTLAALMTLCWAVLVGLALAGIVTVVEALLIAVAGYLVLAAVLWGVTAVAGRGG